MTREVAITKYIISAIEKTWNDKRCKEILEALDQEPETGCKGCIYEKTGNNSTYPCSHCSRCYTDKYKAEIEV